MKYQAALFVVLAGCSAEYSLQACGGGGEKVKRSDVERLIRQLAEQRATPALALRCPELVALRPGMRFECEVDLASGTYPVAIEIEKDGLSAEWVRIMAGGPYLESLILEVAEHSFAGKVDAVDCGEQVVMRDRPVTCAVAGGGQIEASLDERSHISARFIEAKTWNADTQQME